MANDVYFIDLREKYKHNIFDKINRLFDKVKLESIFTKGDLVALKMHFGELGNTAYLRSNYLIPAIERIRKKGAYPFVTDANTLYNGSRNNGVRHIDCAMKNGFSYATLNAPVVIADGVDGSTDEGLEVKGGEYTDKAFIGKEIVNSRSCVVFSHFKGHEVFGFGGALKNIGMGSASKQGKLFLHSGVSPYIVEEKCKGCKHCVSFCIHSAIEFDDKKKKAHINAENCVGCGGCLIACEYGALRINWASDSESAQKKTAEYVKAIADKLENRLVYINFIMDVSPLCDCVPWKDAPIVDDIGIAISKDPVALDKACYDLVNKQRGNKNSALTSNFEPGECKFRGVHPNIYPLHLVEHSEKLGVGSMDYNLKMINAL